jgi:hypothetical protein
MDIINKLAEYYNPPSERVADHPAATVPDLQTQQAEAVPVAPQCIGNIDLKVFLDFVDRRKIDTSGDGHNNCGFNAILAQVGDHSNGDGKVNLLRHRLKYGDESSNEMFDTRSCLDVANLFSRPVVEVCFNGDKITQLSLSIPSTDDLSIHFRGNTLLAQNFVAWCVNLKWPQKRIDTLSQWLTANVPGTVNFNEATPYDIALQLLRYPRTIVLVSPDKGGHFNAAPHKDLQQEDSVLEFLRSSGDSGGAADPTKTLEKPEEDLKAEDSSRTAD